MQSADGGVLFSTPLQAGHHSPAMYNYFLAELAADGDGE
jgi:hypothetical protein